MPFAAALSRHPLATHAVGEVVGQILEQLGDGPDAAVVFVTAPFAGAAEDIAATIRATLHPGALIGASASGVLANGQEVEGDAAVVLFALRLDLADDARPRAVAFRTRQDPEGWSVTAEGDLDDAGPAPTLVLLADPFTFPVDPVVDDLVERIPGLTVVGGMASAAGGPGGNRLVADEAVLDGGAVGLILPSAVTTSAIVSQGCRAVGDPLVVTKASGSMLEEIAGMAALDRVLAIAEEASVEDRRAMSRALQVGLVLDERNLEVDRRDVLVRPVLGADRERGAVAVGDAIEVGRTIQFHVRDADSADEDLRLAMAEVDGNAALVFTCTGRGAALFDEPDHDATVVRDALDGGASAGMFSQGEIGPVRGRHAIHAMAASVLVLHDPA